MKHICVYGASSAAIDDHFHDSAFLLGREIAKAGYGLIFGAGNTGVMGAVARGVHEENGHVIGVIPSFMDTDNIPYKSCDEYILTETMRERKQIMEERAHAFIAAPGGMGTFEEFLEILTLKQLRQHKKAIVLLNICNYYDELQQMLEKTVTCNFAKPASLEFYNVSTTPEEALKHIDNYVYTDFADKWFTDIKER